ncbi:tol-pal system-associated acyl-CoA thioesterase [Parvularcula sp. IMCC14364]|uniref:tol-pal system-associated acyl-CoA thioesterase n=1 Tax=Parvularcula sp. IMCC14364 TaxID=3067902 RepID=UPI0027426D4F|nr:tol-pal system-associated acyl-CoA thioesterase [Parvularcula sp. IMCC14364]
MNQHQIEIRIYYEDTDMSGIVYHANYLKFFERGRTEAFRQTGLGHADLLEMTPPLAFAARRLTVEYLRPARIDDLLTVTSVVTEARGARMVFSQEIHNGDALLATAEVLIACITLEGRPARLPQQVVDYHHAQISRNGD